MDNENFLRNERRRRLAKRLREFVSARGYGKPRHTGSWVDSRELLRELFDMDAKSRSSLDEVDSVDVLALADMIDRPVCRDMTKPAFSAPPGTLGWFVCSECDYKTHTDLIRFRIRFCPHCGREVLW